MHTNPATPHRARRGLRVLGGIALLGLGLAAAPARAIEVLGFYVGGGIGQAEIRASAPSFSVDEFKENHSAWKLVAGVRPISLLGAELAYIDFGSPSETVGGVNVKVDLKATALYGLLYLPIPAPFIDVYGKAGFARLEGDVTASGPAVQFSADAEENEFTAGAGVQFKVGSWAIRGEYERFFVSDSDPSLISLSVTKTFF